MSSEDGAELDDGVDLALHGEYKRTAAALTGTGGSIPVFVVNSSFHLSSQETPVDDDKRREIIETAFFNEAAYIAAGTLGPQEDPYKRNKFNQAASDRLASNREIPDTRMSQ